jgi:hypothetical protein
MQKVKKSCRKLAQKLSCMDTPWEKPHYSARSGGSGTTSASLRTPAGSSEPMTGATFAVCTPPHHSAGKGPAEEDDKYDKDDEDDDYAPGFHIHHHQRGPWQADEIGMSQLGGPRLVPKETSTKLHFLNT